MSIYGFTIQDLVENGRVNDADITILKQWVATQKMPLYPDETIALFYMACEKDIENTKKCAIAYCNSKIEGPDIFNNRILARDDIQQQLRTLNFCILPQRTDKGYVIIMHRLIDTYAPSYHMEVAMKVLFMTLDSSLYDDPPTGIITLFDMTGVNLRHLSRIRISAIKIFFYYLQEALPLKLVSVEILNTVWFFDRVFRLIKPFLNKEIIDKLHFHTSSLKMEDFYENYIPKKCLPSDFGGDLMSVAEIQEQTIKRLEDLSDYFKNEELSRIIPNYKKT